jgi:hypothetical protein
MYSCTGYLLNLVDLICIDVDLYSLDLKSLISDLLHLAAPECRLRPVC